MRIRSIVFRSVLVALCLTAFAASAQQAPPPSQSKAVVMKGRAPVSTELLKIKLPRPVETDLANGAHLMVLEDHRAPQVVFQILIPGAGGYFDPPEMPGLSSITAAMMREGTPTRTTLQISEQLERMASTVGVGAGLAGVDATVSGSSLTNNIGETLSLAADILLNPTFPDEELARYKERTRTGLIQSRANPGFLANEMFARVMFGVHPSSRTSLTVPVLDKVTRADLSAHHKSRFVPDHALIAFAGDITMAEARKLVDARFGAWKKGNVPVPSVTDPPLPGPAKIYFIARPNSVQTNLIVATPAISRTSPDYDVVDLMNSVIGGGPTGRLFITLREEKGYTYGAYSGVGAGRWRGAWSANTEVRTDVTEPALRDLLAEVARLRDEPVPDQEFEAKKRGTIASFALSLESPQAILGNYVTSWIYKLPADYWDRLPERINAVTKAQVQNAARKYLDPDKLQIIAVGDPKIGQKLTPFGAVETYDTEGKPIK